MHIHLHQAEHAVRACMSHRLLLVCILLFSFALRVFELEHLPPFEHPDGVSLAEYSLKVARGDVPWYGVRTDGDTNWAFLQYAPYALFGGSLWALRLTSALWSMLVLTVTYFAVRQMFGARVALFAMLLMGCAHLLIHFSRAVTIVLPSVLTSFLSIGLYCKAQRISADGRRSTGLWLLTGAVLALNLYEYVAARSVFFALAALWLLSLPRQRSAWRPYAHRMLLLAAGFLLIAAPILLWYFQHPNHLLDRFGALSIFHPRNAAINLRLYGQVDTLILLYYQTLRSLGGFFTVWDTSPNYHVESALLDTPTALLLLPGLLIAARRKPKLTLVMLVWIMAGLIAGAILLIEPPTSHHYIVLVPLAIVFAALCLAWLSSTRLGRRCVPVLIAAVVIANVYLYFHLYPIRGAWFSLESDVGYFVREQRNCCTFWYLGEPDQTPRKISALIASATPIHYVRDEEQLAVVITPYLEDEQPDVIIVPNDKVEKWLPRLKQRFPEGREHFYTDRGRSMFCAYRLNARGRLNGIGLTRD